MQSHNSGHRSFAQAELLGVAQGIITLATKTQGGRLVLPQNERVKL